MTEHDLIKIMKTEWPNESFCIDKETWCHIEDDGTHERKTEFKIYVVSPIIRGVFFRSMKNWQDAYDQFKLWKEKTDEEITL